MQFPHASQHRLGRSILRLQDSLKKTERSAVGLHWLSDWQQHWEQRRGAIHRRLDVIEANLERLIDLEHGSDMPNFGLVGVPDDAGTMDAMGPL